MSTPVVDAGHVRSRTAVLCCFVAVAAASCLMAMGLQGNDFRLTSADLMTGTFQTAQVYKGMDCVGQNISPQLSWAGAPPATKSYVITLYDPDAPTGSGWWHWVIANIPASAKELPPGASRTSKMPAGSLETRTDFGTPGYGGPCPPANDSPHRFVFTIYAMKTEKIDVNADMSAAMIGFITNANSIAKTTLEVRFGR